MQPVRRLTKAGGFLSVVSILKIGGKQRNVIDEQNASAAGQRPMGWILALAGVSFLTLVGTTALAEIVAGFLGSLFVPEEMQGTAWSAVRAALIATVFTFLVQLLKGLLEYRTAADFCKGTVRYAVLTVAGTVLIALCRYL